MIFAWDEKKNLANMRKHGISFELAARVFDDPLAISYLDSISDGEERWHTIGSIQGIVIVLVVHTFQEQNDAESPSAEEFRIISARKASKRERAAYESGF